MVFQEDVGDLPLQLAGPRRRSRVVVATDYQQPLLPLRFWHCQKKEPWKYFVPTMLTQAAVVSSSNNNILFVCYEDLMNSSKQESTLHRIAAHYFPSDPNRYPGPLRPGRTQYAGGHASMLDQKNVTNICWHVHNPAMQTEGILATKRARACKGAR